MQKNEHNYWLYLSTTTHNYIDIDTMILDCKSMETLLKDTAYAFPKS
ncbi:MAG TPA: hypothetical protein VN456_08535 [Desulfosporosinus sp.]|nr:hypothetical protein [Desulfosporosinus sp.]